MRIALWVVLLYVLILLHRELRIGAVLSIITAVLYMTSFILCLVQDVNDSIGRPERP